MTMPVMRTGWIVMDADGTIIDTRADEVQAALEKNGLRVIRRREKTGWVALEAKLADQ